MSTASFSAVNGRQEPAATVSHAARLRALLVGNASSWRRVATTGFRPC